MFISFGLPIISPTERPEVIGTPVWYAEEEAGGPGGYSSVVQGIPNLLAFWKLGEGSGTQIVDFVGTRHGTYTGTIGHGATSLPPGADSGAIDFAGAGSGSVPHDAGLALSAFTLSFWFKLNDFPADPNVFNVVTKEQSGINLGDFLVRTEDNGVVVIQFQTAAAAFRLTTAELALATPYHLCVRADGTGFDAFLNGQYLGEDTSHTNAWASNTQALQFATAPFATVLADVVLDEVALYSRVLTQAEVAELAQQTIAAIAAADAAGVPESATTAIDVTANDTFIGSKAELTVAIMSQPAGGDSVAVDGNNDIAYTAGAVAADTARSFTYQITDANGASNTATCNVTVINTAAAPANALCFVESGGDTVEVASMAALASAVAAAPPGRNILIAPGTYTGGSITLNGIGASGNPIIVRPRDGIGTVTITSSTWSVPTTSHDLVIERLYFNRGRVYLRGQRQRFSRNRWRNADNAGALYIEGLSNSRIDHCDFATIIETDTAARSFVYIDPITVGTGATRNVRFDYNYMHDINPSISTNGQSIIRITGRHNTFDLPAGTIITIDHCLFSDIHMPAGGEDELISIKSGGWTLQFCTFINSSMRVAMRHANNTIVRSCWFEDMRPTSALDCLGDNNLIIGNRFEGGNADWRGPGVGTSDWDAIDALGHPLSAAYATCRFGRFIGNTMTNGAVMQVGRPVPAAGTVDALNNNLWNNTGTVDTTTWASTHTGTTFNQDNEPFVAAVQLTPTNVGLAAADPLC